MAKSRVSIQETFDLPSAGRLYDGAIPSKVTLRAMTTMEEKQRLAGSGIMNIPNIIKACSVKPADLQIGKMKLFDVNFLMYKLRIVTYGSQYKVTLICRKCGHKYTTVIDLDDINVNSVPDDFKEPFEIGPLPVSGDVLETRLLSLDDYVRMEKESKKILAKYPDYIGDPEYILGYKYKISKINGEIPQDFELTNYVQGMHARDAAYFDSKYLKVSNGLGLDIDLVDICPKCGEEVEFSLPINDEFFRPSYDNE